MYRRQRSRSARGRGGVRSGSTHRKPERRERPAHHHMDIRDNPVNQAAFWSQDTYTLEEIAQKNTLPQIVRCASELISDGGQGLPVNIHVPMLLCPGRTTDKLLAKHVGFGARNYNLVETDDTIAIPSDYGGNFLRLQAQTTQDHSVRKTLAEIAGGNSPAFLTLSPIVVFYHTEVTSDKLPMGATESAGGSQTTNQISGVSGATNTSVIQRRVMQPPGSVYLILGVGKGVAKSKKKKREVPLLKCSDPRGNTVFITADQPGDFVEVVPPNQGDTKLSVGPTELMVTNRYPSLVRFVYGESVPRLRPCSNMFTLVDTFKEESLLGCLMYPTHALMIELPMVTSLRFQLALNPEELLKLDLPLHARNIVNQRRDKYLTDLKLKCKFLHKVRANEGIDGKDDHLSSATVRTRMYANESFFYL